MRIRTILSSCLVVLTSIITGLGCQKDSIPPCKNGSCCWEGQEVEYVKRLDDVRADYGGSAFSIKEPISIINGYEAHGALICPIQQDMLSDKKLFNNVTVVGTQVRLVDSTRIYPYRVWGIIYNIKSITGIIPRPTYAIYIERVEEFK